MPELRDLSAAEIAPAVRAGELDPVELVESCLAAIEAERLNAVITACPEEALRRARGRLDGPLAGVPLLVKDLVDTAGVRTTYGSSIYADHVPERTAPAVERLEAAGAIVIGKANLHEFAWGVTSQNPHFGWVGNPRRPDRIPGGSSGGNAAALAAGLCALGIGSDTGGSIRLPSACCGTVGFKPSLGKVPTEGCFALVPSIDTLGPMARTVADCALAYSILSGEPVPAPRLEGLTVGLLLRPPPVTPPGVEPPPFDGRAAAFRERLEALGARVVETELAGPDGDTWPLFYGEAALTHRATFPARRAEYGHDLQVKLDDAQRVAAPELEASRAAVARWRERAARELSVDLLASPTLGCEIPPADADELEVRLPVTPFTRPFNYLGWAALAIGNLQLAGRDDAAVLAAGLAWEAAYGVPE